MYACVNFENLGGQANLKLSSLPCACVEQLTDNGPENPGSEIICVHKAHAQEKKKNPGLLSRQVYGRQAAC